MEDYAAKKQTQGIETNKQIAVASGGKLLSEE